MTSHHRTIYEKLSVHYVVTSTPTGAKKHINKEILPYHKFTYTQACKYICVHRYTTTFIVHRNTLKEFDKENKLFCYI